MTRNGVHGKEAIPKKNPVIVGEDLNYRDFKYTINDPKGIRNSADGVDDFQHFQKAGVKSGAISTGLILDATPSECLDDPLLAKLIEHWHTLPDEARLLIGDILDDHVASEI